MERLRRSLPLLAWLVALGAGIALFHGMGSGPLAAPPLTRPDTWGDWAAQREPLTAGVAVLRLIVLGLAWYLVGVTTIGVVARLLRAARLVRMADALTVPAVRRLLQGALGLGLATAVVSASAVPMTPRTAPLASSGAVLAAAEQAEDTAVTLRALPADAALQGDTALQGDDSRALRLQADAPTFPPVQPGLDAQGEVGEVTLRLLGQDSATLRALTYGHDTTHTVKPGESLWSIAQDALAARWDREPTDAEVLTYWLEVIEQNRQDLADPDNPDLIFPGQQVHLPPLEPGADTSGGPAS